MALNGPLLNREKLAFRRDRPRLGDARSRRFLCPKVPPLGTLLRIQQTTVKRILVYSAWMKEMCEPYWNGAVGVWPVGIDTEKWKPSNQDMEFDVLVYDKIMWKHERQRSELLSPLLSILKQKKLTTATVRYGYYQENKYWELLHKSKAMLFLCEHETQGIAYQQALSCGVPVLAWEQGMWLDPSYYPRIKASASSVPYFDERCGLNSKTWRSSLLGLKSS